MGLQSALCHGLSGGAPNGVSKSGCTAWSFHDLIGMTIGSRSPAMSTAIFLSETVLKLR
jgi:hypothetical protein